MTRRRRMSFVTLDQTVEAILSYFFELIDRGEPSARIFNALILLRGLSKHVGQVLNRDTRTKYYFFFAAATLRERFPARFLDGVFDVDVFSDVVGTGPGDPSRFSQVTARQCLADRLKSAKRLSTMDEATLRSRSSAYYPMDVPTCVHLRVGVLVGRVRYMAQRCRQNHATTQCEHCGATFLTFDVAPIHAISSSSSSSSSSDDDETVPTPPLYWESVAMSGAQLNINPNRVCSMACHLSSTALLEKLLPEEFELTPKNGGFAGVVETARLCIKRNEIYYRQLRVVRKSNLKTNEHTLIRRCIDLLNIDTCLCLCAARVVDVPVLRDEAVVLPGQFFGWRDERGKYTKALEIIKSNFQQHGGMCGGLITDENRPPKWVAKSLNSISHIFSKTR